MKFLIKLSAFIVFMAALGICVYYYALKIEPKMLKVTQYNYAKANLDAPIKIALFCDTHLGFNFDVNDLAKVVDKINEQNADLVIFGGDFFDNYQRDKQNLDLDKITSELQRINATTAKIAVCGNHDLGGGAVRIIGDVWQSGGFTLLNGENAVFEELGIEVVGFEDAQFGAFDPLQAAQTQLFSVGVCHEPDVADVVVSKNVDIMFSGHTHGGQVLLPFITDKVLPPLGKKYRKGEFDVNGGKLFVSSGLGTTNVGLRLFNVPEVVVLDIN